MVGLGKLAVALALFVAAANAEVTTTFEIMIVEPIFSSFLASLFWSDGKNLLFIE